MKPNKLGPGLVQSIPPNLSLVHPLPLLPMSTEPLNLSHVDQFKGELFNQLSSSVNFGAAIRGGDVESGEIIAQSPVEVASQHLKFKRVKEKKTEKGQKQNSIKLIETIIN